MRQYRSVPQNIRDDFRCAVCRRKSAFHCEHDTPYRDELLGTYDSFPQERRSQITATRRDIAAAAAQTSKRTKTSAKKSEKQHKSWLNDGYEDPAMYYDKHSRYYHQQEQQEQQQQSSKTMKNTQAKSRTCVIL